MVAHLFIQVGAIKPQGICSLCSSSVVYKTSVENAWVYTKKIFAENGIQIREENENESIFGKTEPGSINKGNLVGVWFDPINEEEVRVTAYTKKYNSLQIVRGYTSKEFHDMFQIYVDTE